MPTNGDATGQAPPISSPDSNGQVPPVSQASSTDDDGNANGHAPDSSPKTAEQWEEIARKARNEAAKYRIDSKELAELRAFKQQQEDAKLSTDEKRDKELATAQERAAAAEERAQRVAVRAEAKIAATSLGIKTELALRLLDIADITFNEDGDPTNVTDLLVKAAHEFGLAVTAPGASNGNGNGNGRNANGARGQQQSQQPSGIGVTPANPARNTGTGPVGGWSWEAISSLTKEQYEGLSPAERAAMSQFIGKHPKR